MAKITFKDRTGKDFFEFTERSLVDSRLATDWAIEKFVLIDGQEIDIVKISKLSDVAYLNLSGKIFTTQPNPDIVENNEGLHYKGLTIKSKTIKKDLITLMQTNVERYQKKSATELLKNTIPIFYQVSVNELLLLPYELVVFMTNKVNFFLSELTSSRSEFEIDDESLWVDNSRGTTDRELDNMVPSSNQDSGESRQGNSETV